MVIWQTYAAFSELFGINWRCKVQSPCVVGHWIFPVHKAFGCLTNACSCEQIINFVINCRFKIKWFSTFGMVLTWLNESNVEYFIYLAVVCGNMENTFRRILDTGNVDGNEIFGYLLPFHGARTTRWHMEHFGPQPEYTNEIKLVVMKQQKLCFTFKLFFSIFVCAFVSSIFLLAVTLFDLQKKKIIENSLRMHRYYVFLIYQFWKKVCFRDIHNWIEHSSKCAADEWTRNGYEVTVWLCDFWICDSFFFFLLLFYFYGEERCILGYFRVSDVAH